MDDYPETAAAPSGEKSLAKRIAEISPTIRFDAHVDSYGGMGVGGGDHSYMKERHARYKKEVEAIEEQLSDWNPEEVAALMEKSLRAELAIKRAELLKCEAEMDLVGVKHEGEAGDEDDSEEDDSGDSSDSDEDGKVYAEGNPYSVVKRGNSFVVENTESGHVKGKHASKKKAMRQYRLLEGVEHGWTPTKGK